ncbi:MAG: MBL fold metallo-hydrolase [Halocynthiibacter sp.]
MNDFVAFLGTKGGPSIRAGSANPSSNLLSLSGELIVIDCGLGVTRGFVEQGFALTDLKHILITHLHSDHCLELGALLHTAWASGLSHPVRVFGPKGLKEYWVNFTKTMGFDIQIRIEDEGRPDISTLVEIVEINAGDPFNIGDIAISTIATEHPPVDCLAYRFDAHGKSIVFSGDTTYLPRMADFAKGADILVHEAMLGDALPALLARIGNADDRLMAHWKRSHTFCKDAAKTAADAGVGALVFNHLIPCDDPDFGDDAWQRSVETQWDGPFHIARDGLRIPLK